ncbi:MAG: redoxin domain-containing protein [Actinomycetota bacterium]|nr:redoxin domain-containing protein [Actinomycetota bacterium]
MAERPRQRGRYVRWSAIVVILVAIVLTVAFATRFGTDPGLVASPLIGRPAPDVTLPYLEQEGELSLQELRGEIVVVNFWASWCLECRLEHPDLMSVAEQYRASGVRVLGVVFNDRPEQAMAMLDELGRGYDYLLDPGSRAAIEFGVFGVPETFFINREGMIVAKVTGPSTGSLLASTLDQILLGQQPGARTTGTVQSEPGE